MCIPVLKGEGGWNYLEGHYTPTISYAKSTVECKTVGRGKFDKTQRNIGLLCGALQVMRVILWTFSLPINLPYYEYDVWLTVHRNSVWIRKTN